MNDLKPLPLLGLCLLAGACAGLLVSLVTPLPLVQAQQEEVGPSAGSDSEDVDARLAELVARAEDLEARLVAQELAPRGPSRRSALGGVDAAVDRWMRAHAPEPAGEASDEVENDPVSLAVDRILSSRSSEELSPEFWKDLAASGELAEVIQRMEQLTEHSPYDPGLRVSLAQALVQSTFQRGAGPEREQALDRAEEQYEKALELDDENWDARFGKAVTLSVRPGFLGKSSQAIEELEALAQQQERGAPQPRYAETYYYLGNLYAQMGESEKALAAWGRGGALFPDDVRFGRQIETEQRVRGGDQ